MITKEQLAELASLARAATPGPWIKRGVSLVEAKTGELSRASIAEVFHAAEDGDFISAANPVTVLALLDRIIELERDSARLDYMIENGLFVEAFIMPDLPKMRPLCWLVNFKTGPIVKKQFEDPRAAIDAAMAPPRCTCPSGDGSLRWPCPRHPPESA